MYGGMTMSNYKTCIINIKEYRPMFTRVPEASGGMSALSRIALEVNVFALLGANGESVYENPRGVETNQDIHEWCEGLRADGGGGCVAKDFFE